MKTEYLISLYLIFFSLLIIMLISKLSCCIFKSSDSLGHITIKGFLKGHIKQRKKQKIFFVHFFKYPLFLSASLITLQIQLIGLVSFLEDDLFIMPTSMILYVVLKSLYVNDKGRGNQKYFNFISTLDSFFFDLLLIIMVFVLEGELHSYVRLGVFIFFIGNVFLKISNLKMVKIKENQFRNQGETIFEEVIFNFGEYIYNISLLFFAVSTFFDQNFIFGKGVMFFWLGYHLKVLFYIILITIIINGMEWILRWPMKKRILHRDVLRVKYILAPIFLLTLVMQMGGFDG